MVRGLSVLDRPDGFFVGPTIFDNVKPDMTFATRHDGYQHWYRRPHELFPFGGAGHSMFGDIKGHCQEIFHFFTDSKVGIGRWF